MAKPTHKCKRCGAFWVHNHDATWSLFSRRCGVCCDAVAMGDQIEPLTAPINAAASGVLQFFEFSHLPPFLSAVSQKFAELAWEVATGPNNPEATVALRKLLEAKDAAVRAVLYKA